MDREKMVEKIGNIDINVINPIVSRSEIEEELLEIVKENSEEDYNSIISNKKNSFFLYQLSHIRRNIFVDEEIFKGKNVLEISANCGPHTSYIAKYAKHVDCVEPSLIRSQINANRNKQYENISIYVANYTNMNIFEEGKYDVVVMLSDYERFFAGYKEEKLDEVFHQLKRLLNSDGIIIFACDNRIGLKYLAGNQNEMTPGYFIMSEANEGTIEIGYTKKELVSAIEHCDMDYKFYYPYPNQFFPMSVYSDEYLPKKDELKQNFMNFNNARLLLFDESKVFDSIIEEGLFSEFTNAFLLEIKKR